MRRWDEGLGAPQAVQGYWVALPWCWRGADHSGISLVSIKVGG